MRKAFLALASLSVLAAGCASAPSGAKAGVTTVNAPLGAAVHVGSAVAEEQPAHASGPQMASPATVTGHATGLGSSTPQPLGPVAATEPAAGPLQPAPHPNCPARQHMGIVCTAP